MQFVKLTLTPEQRRTERQQPHHTNDGGDDYGGRGVCDAEFLVLYLAALALIDDAEQERDQPGADHDHAEGARAEQPVRPQSAARFEVKELARLISGLSLKSPCSPRPDAVRPRRQVMGVAESHG